MKKIYGILFLLALMAFKTNLQAQKVCTAVSAQLIEPNPQNGSYNYYGTKVSIAEPYGQDIRVTGGIYDIGDPSAPAVLFSLTIVAGTLSAETPNNYFQTAASSSAGVEIKSVSPCPPSGDYRYYNINSAELLTNIVLKNKIAQMYLSGSNNINPNVQYDIDNMKLITFEGSNIQGIYIEEINFAPNSIHNHTFVTFVQDNLVADMAGETLVNTDNNNNLICDFIDQTTQIIGSVRLNTDNSISVKANPNWSNPYALLLQSEKYYINWSIPYGMLLPSPKRVTDFRDRYAACMNTGMCQLQGGCGGGYWGAMAGHFVRALGPFGELGAMLGCTLHATFL